MHLTLPAYFSLHPTDPLDDLGQGEKVPGPKWAPTGRHRDEHVGLANVGPGCGQGLHHPVVTEEVHAVLSPRPLKRDEGKLPIEPWVERVRYPDGSLFTGGIGCS